MSRKTAKRQAFYAEQRRRRAANAAGHRHGLWFWVDESHTISAAQMEAIRAHIPAGASVRFSWIPEAVDAGATAADRVDTRFVDLEMG
jgi:hypothetical protein